MLIPHTSGNLYVCGSVAVSGYTIPGTTVTTSGTGLQGFLVKYDSNGIGQWANLYPMDPVTTTNGAGNIKISTDMWNNIIFAAQTNVSGYTIPGSTITKSSNSRSIFFIKHDSNGTVLWGRHIGIANIQGHSFLNGISTDSSGNVYIVARTQSNVGLTYPATSHTKQNTDVDTFISKYNASGTAEWSAYTYATSSGASRQFISLS